MSEFTHSEDLAHNRFCTKLKIGRGTVVVLTDAAVVKELRSEERRVGKEC